MLTATCETYTLKFRSDYPPSGRELEELLVLLEIVLEVPTPVTKQFSASSCFLLVLTGL